jgi:hypothetical protein
MSGVAPGGEDDHGAGQRQAWRTGAEQDNGVDTALRGMRALRGIRRPGADPGGSLPEAARGPLCLFIGRLMKRRQGVYQDRRREAEGNGVDPPVVSADPKDGPRRTLQYRHPFVC